MTDAVEIILQRGRLAITPTGKYCYVRIRVTVYNRTELDTLMRAFGGHYIRTAYVFRWQVSDVVGIGKVASAVIERTPDQPVYKLMAMVVMYCEADYGYRSKRAQMLADVIRVKSVRLSDLLYGGE